MEVSMLVAEPRPLLFRDARLLPVWDTVRPNQSWNASIRRASCLTAETTGAT